MTMMMEYEAKEYRPTTEGKVVESNCPKPSAFLTSFPFLAASLGLILLVLVNVPSDTLLLRHVVWEVILQSDSSSPEKNVSGVI